MNIQRLLSLLPPVIREKLFYRFLNSRQQAFSNLFGKATLLLAPKFAMYELMIGDVISGQIAINGFYEWKLSQKIQELAKKGGLFVDVGANIGYFSILWASGDPKNKIVAVEASPRNQASLQKNVINNNIEQQVTVLCSAAGSENKNVAFTVGPKDQTGWGGIGPGVQGWEMIETQMIRLDSYFNEEIIDVMKIDVEGADVLVIEGCERLLANRQIKILLFEQNDSRMQTLGVTSDRAFALLRKHGYTLQKVSVDEWMAQLK